MIRTEEETPQGGSISCALANIYLHYTLDLWFEKKFKPHCQGEAYLVRFVDDFVVSFQYRTDAESFQRQLRERLARFNLELAEEKTRLLLFGRFAAERRAMHGQRTETFEFLGFKHVCGKDRGARFAVIRLPSVKSCRKFLAHVHEWLVRHMHWKRCDQQRHLLTMPLPVLRAASLPEEAELGSPRSQTAMATHVAPTEPAPPTPLELFGQPRVVQTAAATEAIAPPDGLMTLTWRRRSGEPIAGNLHDGF